MTHHDFRSAFFSALVAAALVACTTPNPDYRKPKDGSVGCEPGAKPRCDGANLIRCNADGTAEVTEPCALGCNATELRCFDTNPSNGLAKFLDLASGQPDLNLGDSATINTDTGEVKMGDNMVPVYNATLAQSPAPTIRVYVVKSLTAKDVTVSGKNAIAIVSAGDINITGAFSASAKGFVRGEGFVPGPGEFDDGNCRGQNLRVGCINSDCQGGPGGGGFGSPGGSGGSANSARGFMAGGTGGTTTGNAELVPLRGGCSGGNSEGPDNFDGGGGGAIQLVSRTLIAVTGLSGVVAANGGYGGGGGGSGGGVLLEAPIVNISGRVVANGAGGMGQGDGENGRLDTTAAKGGEPSTTISPVGRGGNGAAGTFGAMHGDSVNTTELFARGGSGGGGFGRIRINTASGGIRGTGVFSPAPSTGTLASR